MLDESPPPGQGQHPQPPALHLAGPGDHDDGRLRGLCAKIDRRVRIVHFSSAFATIYIHIYIYGCLRTTHTDCQRGGYFVVATLTGVSVLFLALPVGSRAAYVGFVRWGFGLAVTNEATAQMLTHGRVDQPYRFSEA